MIDCSPTEMQSIREVFLIVGFIFVTFLEINVGKDGSEQHGMALVSIMSY